MPMRNEKILDRTACTIFTPPSCPFHRAVRCFEFLRAKGTVRVENGGRLEWCAVGQGGGNGSMALPGVNSTNVFRSTYHILYLIYYILYLISCPSRDKATDGRVCSSQAACFVATISKVSSNHHVNSAKTNQSNPPSWLVEVRRMILESQDDIQFSYPRDDRHRKPNLKHYPSLTPPPSTNPVAFQSIRQ